MGSDCVGGIAMFFPVFLCEVCFHQWVVFGRNQGHRFLHPRDRGGYCFGRKWIPRLFWSFSVSMVLKCSHNLFVSCRLVWPT